ncbi:hypothetical protein BFJ71_g11033 [Fusarium oxysporum]|nr:hypothetical protein BFJ71_g11033 [Fusarium oxysporum]
MRSSIFVSIALVFSTSVATLTERSRNAALSVFATIPDTLNLENFALRHNGDIVVYSASGLLGIAKLEKDVFYVAGANVTGSTPIAISTNAVWKVDLRGLKIKKDNNLSKPAKVSLVTEIPSAGLLNGMTQDNSRLPLSDSALGQILLLNVNTKEYKTIINDETTAGRPERLVAANGLCTYGF